MKLKEFFGKDIDVNCYIQLWFGTHHDEGELLAEAYGNENADFEPWYNMDVVYITIGEGKLIIEVA